MESEVIFVDEESDVNEILSYQWKFIKSRIQYERELKDLQTNNKDTDIKSDEDMKKNMCINTLQSREENVVEKIQKEESRQQTAASSPSTEMEPFAPIQEENDEDDFY